MTDDPPANPLKPFAGSDASAALILVDGQRYLMQLRDDIPGIFAPGCWGLFGGAVNDGESHLEGLRRELQEEIEMEVEEATYFTSFDIDFSFAGLGIYKRQYFVVPCPSSVLPTLRVHEGQDMKAFTFEEIEALPNVAPYDNFAIWLHANQEWLGPRKGGS